MASLFSICTAACIQAECMKTAQSKYEHCACFEAVGMGMAAVRARMASDVEMKRPRIVGGREGSKS